MLNLLDTGEVTLQVKDLLNSEDDTSRNASVSSNMTFRKFQILEVCSSQSVFELVHFNARISLGGCLVVACVNNEVVFPYDVRTLLL